MPARHVFLLATILAPIVLSLAYTHCGLPGVGLCGGLVALLISTLLRQPQQLRQAVAQQTQAFMHTQAALQQQLAEQAQAHEALCWAKEAAEWANRAKDVFLVNISHELRMPLNAIIGYSEMLQEEVMGLGNQGVITDIRKMHTASLHLRALINDMLDLAKIAAGIMEFCLESFDVTALLHEVVTALQPLAQQYDNTLAIHVEEPLHTMHADRPKLRQSLENLLRHAYTCTSQGTITLRARRETVDNCDWVTFSVCDAGLSVSQEQMEYLFQDVVYSDATTARRYGGTGLGFALSRRLCRMMGGDIILTSMGNEGSLCTLRMPAQVELLLSLGAPASVPVPREEERCEDAGTRCAVLTMAHHASPGSTLEAAVDLSQPGNPDHLLAVL